MAVQTSYPGVYVQEVPSGVRTISGVSTSVALFIGRTYLGPLNQPIQCLNKTEFKEIFSDNTSLSEMPHYVNLFFDNGGTQCYVMRIAHDASPATVVLKSESGEDVLVLTAKQPGLLGESIRANITYSGIQPENTFNMELFRWETNAAGTKVATDVELHQNLNMNPNSPRYAPDIISQESKLIIAEPVDPLPSLSNGYSQSQRPINATNVDDSPDNIENLIGEGSTIGHSFRISIDGNVPVNISFESIVISDFSEVFHSSTEADSLAEEIVGRIQSAYSSIGVFDIDILVSFESGPTSNTRLLKITSNKDDETGSVVILPASSNDLTGPLMLGTAQGGLEVSAYGNLRPAANGLTFYAPEDLVSFATLTQSVIVSIPLDIIDTNGDIVPFDLAVDLSTVSDTEQMFKASSGYSPINNDNDGVREKLAIIRDAVNDYRAANSRSFFWKATLAGYRLSITSTRGDDNHRLGTVENFISNVRYYSLGTYGRGDYQVPAETIASDGTAPRLEDYDNAYTVIENEIDIFNLLVLPPDKDPDFSQSDLWGPASSFCQQQRAFLLMDAPPWMDSQAASNEVDDLRIGLVKDHSALFYPRLLINDQGRNAYVGPGGAIAGLMARIDCSRGVWKAPAGTEADIRGIKGLEYRFSDRENGVLNPRGINAIRIFPNGIVNWGARTMDGDDDFASEWKYIPVRRTALFIEESLYRGLKWVVFEPNDEPLWGQIRLNVGAFMHDLFRQGAFQGKTKQEAYFVKCDSETTTQSDINAGRVNVWVGFAPLKPAEFVILYLQQMTGQIQV